MIYGKYIHQAAWRVRLLHLAAKALGVLGHVEGMPIGSNRIYPSKLRDFRTEAAGAAAGDGGTMLREGIRI